MKATKLTLATLVAAGAMFTSCSSDDDNGGGNTGGGVSVNTPELSSVINSSFDRGNMQDYVSNYSSLFTREGESTVSFGGQTTRLKMTVELGSDLKTQSESATDIQSRFETGQGFGESVLNDSGKNVRSKTSSSIGLFGSNKNSSGQGNTNVELIENFISGHDAVKAAWLTEATAGNPGFVNDGDGSTRYVNADGYELNQLFTKSMSGALAYDQAVNHYLNRLDDENDGTNNYRTANDEGTLVEGKTYTTMEHHWDEAFGYIYGNIAKENLIYKYIDNVAALPKFPNFEENVLKAFVLGRIAIAEKDYTKRDEQVAFLRENLGIVIAVRSVNYIVAGANFLDDTSNANRVQDALHDLSEGYGFVNSLRYIVDADGQLIFTDAEVDAYLAILNADNGVWDLSPSNLIDNIAKPIAAKFSDWEVNDVKTVEVSSQSDSATLQEVL